MFATLSEAAPATNSGYQTGAATYSFTHVVVASAKRFLEVSVSMLSILGSSVTGITYGGVALVRLNVNISISGTIRVEQWGLLAPAVGSASVAVTLSTALDSIAGARSYRGVDLVNPIDAITSAAAVGPLGPISLTTITPGALLCDVFASDDTSIAADAAQTTDWNVTGTLGSGAGSTKGPIATPGSVSMEWTGVGALASAVTSILVLRPAVEVEVVQGGLVPQTAFARQQRVVAY